MLVERDQDCNPGVSVLIIPGIIVGLLVIVVLLVVARQRWHQTALAAGQALLAATEIGDVDQMRNLLTQRVDINARNAQGWTPLHVASAGGDITLVELLLRHGANVNAESYVGATPLDHAITYGQRKDVADLLRAHGAQGNTSWDAIF